MPHRSFGNSLEIDCPYCGQSVMVALEAHADGDAGPMLPTTPPLPLLVLTPAQLAVVVRIAKGEPRKVIAHALGIALGTVNLRIRCARLRAGCKTRAELIIAADRSGLLRADRT